MWEPDLDLLAATLDAIDEEARALAGGPADIRPHALSLLEAVGTAVALHREHDARGHVADDLLPLLRDELARLELPELDDAAVIVLEHAPRCLTLDPDELDAGVQDLLDALRVRDRAELLRLGAESLGIAGAFSDEAEAARMSFDEGLEPELWQLVPLGDLRTTELEWMSPALRERFPWRSRGAELGPDALHDPRRFDAVTRVFPEARQHLDAFLATMPPKMGKVIDLRTLFERRRAALQRDERGGLRAAAASGGPAAGEVPLARSAEAEIGCDGGTLIVDVLADLASGAVPALARAGRRIELSPVPGTNLRFAVALSDGDLGSSGWRVELPLATGTVEIALDDSAAD
ncbi:MAG: hypothetical protein OHK0013_11940 [Sandaracinaceae bacterium]